MSASKIAASFRVSVTALVPKQTDARVAASQIYAGNPRDALLTID
jgi:hypothetical protein